MEPTPRLRQRGWQRALKLLGDRVLAALLLLMLSPLLLAMIVVSWITMGSGVFFRQQRPGYRGQPFWIVKFRTMTDRRGPDGKLLPDAERMTRFGSWLRSTSLDELPELWNVLCGDMSFVGPRPLLMQYLGRYSPEQARRHDVVPGITGLAQIMGRNSLSWEEKFKLDVWYVNHWSLRLDVSIVLRTVLVVIRREGISAEGVVTAVEFFPSKQGTVDRGSRTTV